MHVKTINGREYIYKSIRRKAKVCSEYMGPAVHPMFELAMAVTFEAEDERKGMQAARAKVAEEARGRREEDRAGLVRARRFAPYVDSLEAYGGEVDAAIARALEALGLHRPKRGRWRRRRGMLGEIAKREGGEAWKLRELAALAERGDRLAWDELRSSLAAIAYEGGGDLSALCEDDWTSDLASNSDEGLRRGIEAKMASIRLELAPPGSDPVIQLLATRAALEWLTLAVMDHLVHRQLCDRAVNEKSTAFWARLQDRTAGRYRKSLLAIARARRLALPSLLERLETRGRESSDIAAASPEESRP